MCARHHRDTDVAKAPGPAVLAEGFDPTPACSVTKSLLKKMGLTTWSGLKTHGQQPLLPRPRRLRGRRR
jgi:hypothetical protein